MQSYLSAALVPAYDVVTLGKRFPAAEVGCALCPNAVPSRHPTLLRWTDRPHLRVEPAETQLLWLEFAVADNRLDSLACLASRYRWGRCVVTNILPIPASLPFHFQLLGSTYESREGLSQCHWSYDPPALAYGHEFSEDLGHSVPGRLYLTLPRKR